MADAPSLAAVQHWMQQALLDPQGADARDVLTPSRRLPAHERLLVYQRGYRMRLLKTMRTLHPASAHLLGHEIFDSFAQDYLDAHPSRSPTLAGLSDGFARHLADTRPDSAPGTPREPWIDLLIDLVRFERAYAEVLDGPGPENSSAPAPPPRLLRLSAPVHAYLAAVYRGEDPEPPTPRPVFLAVRRRDYTVVTRALSREAYERLRQTRPTPTGGSS